MDSRSIRRLFFDYFGEREHARVPSSSLVPNDPTLLLTNAGMNQFKPYFLGEQSPPFKRAMSVQKCFRTTDIEEVGKTARHLTFFEMMGNFSFGDYYKEKACEWSWDLVTQNYGIDVERIWATVFQTDDEAEQIWIDHVGVRPERVVRRGIKDNFWYGAGPCGPCSEIFVDLGEDFGPASDDGPAGNEDRYVEVWNLVFMQNDCNPDMEPIAELPKKNIDTGLGVERMAMVLQNARSIYETDTFGSLIERAEELTGRRYNTDPKVDVGLRILADHARALTFLIADGVLPSNEERGYVLRRVMRRAVRHARLLGREGSVLPELVDRTVALMGDEYPEIKERYSFIVEVANREEERFDATLKQGLSMLEAEIAKAGAKGDDIPGPVAFKLHDTFGFPIDITTDIAADAGLGVDRDSFERLMAEQRERAREARRSTDTAVTEEALAGLLERNEATDFIGYEFLDTTGEVVAIADSRGWEGNLVAKEGDEVDLILDRTVFYAEGGGQVGDRGAIRGPDGTAEVIDTRRLAPGITGHRVIVRAGELKVGDQVEAHVDHDWRFGSQRAHTATHILHWALREKLGEHAKQAGSLVEPGRLRFDFTHFDPLGERVDEVREDIQTRVVTDDSVRAYETSYDYARSIGAMAIFGEKYGDFVRVVEVGDYSKELCGGTHVPHTSQIGVVVVTGEGSVGANLRRIEALVGPEGIDYLQRKVRVLERAAETLKTNPDSVAERVEKLVQTQKEMERRIAEVERKSAQSDAADLASSADDVDGTRLIVARRDIGVDGLRSLAQKLKGELGSAIVLLGSVGETNANLVGGVTKDVVQRGISARDLLAPGAALLGGGAGGKPELSISGGPKKDQLDAALEAVANAARSALRG
ncbi:MAG: alanine--tRNA ligase [Actinomycetota bacterium]